MRFRHKRTGRIIDVPDSEAFRFQNSRFETLLDDEIRFVNPPTPGLAEEWGRAARTILRTQVPDGTVAEVLTWAGDDPERRAAALEVEKAGKKRKGVIEGLS